MVAQTTKRTSASPATGLPKTVRLLHLTIPLISGGTTDSDSLGEWHANKAEIHYDPNATEPVLRETLLHEMLHAVLDHTGLDPEDHETIIRSISPLLLHLLKENPKMFAWLVQ
jgi:Zn-dependent peptidase ImmA (M78 family)